MASEAYFHFSKLCLVNSRAEEKTDVTWECSHDFRQGSWRYLRMNNRNSQLLMKIHPAVCDIIGAEAATCAESHWVLEMAE